MIPLPTCSGDLRSSPAPARIRDGCRCLDSFLGGRIMHRTLLLVGLAAAIIVGSAQNGHAQFAGVGGVYIDPDSMLRETSTLAAGDLRAKLENGITGAKPSQQ